jgi:hypothetical protein
LGISIGTSLGTSFQISIRILNLKSIIFF